MSNDAIDWVTIKIPKTVRDLARDDDRTYGEIMQAGMGDSDTEPMRVVPVEDVVGHGVHARSLDQEMSERLDRIENGVKEATNAAQSADRKLEDLGR